MADKKLQADDKAQKSSDPELDELLDSALEDLKNDKVEAKTEKSEAGGPAGEASEGFDNPEWTEEFIKQAAQQFESNMANLFTNLGAEVSSDNIQENFQKMAEAAAQVISNPTLETNPQADNFASTISQTLQNLSLGAENLQNPFSESEMLNMFGENSSGNQFLPFMQGMMQSLLSKEVLLPSLKDIADRYPAWLESQRGALPAAEVSRYEQQLKLMQTVCAELEGEAPADSEQAKRERFEKVLGLMQEMQNLGQPPAELVGEPAVGLQFDPQGNPMLPQNLDPNNCQIM